MQIMPAVQRGYNVHAGEMATSLLNGRYVCIGNEISEECYNVPTWE